VTVVLDAVHLHWPLPDGPELEAFLAAVGLTRAEAH
jgi:hypothetical protein